MKTILLTFLAGFFLFVSPVASAPVLDEAPDPVVSTTAKAATYQIDSVHSELSFRIRHLMGRVFGTFREWNGTVVADPSDLSTIEVNATVQVASIETFNEQRNQHLLTPDFFAVEEYPEISFVSKRSVQNGDKIELRGDLTIRGTTKPVVLEGIYLGLGQDPWGGERIAFLASTTIDRQDFGVSFNQLVDGTGMIGDEVEIEIAIEAVRQ